MLLAAGVALRWRRPRAAFVACGSGWGLCSGDGVFGPVLLALALTVYPMAVTLPLRRWAGCSGCWCRSGRRAPGEAYLGALDPILYAELVMAAGLAVLPTLLALLGRGRREASSVSGRRTGAGPGPRNGCGSRARCTTWSGTACRW